MAVTPNSAVLAQTVTGGTAVTTTANTTYSDTPTNTVLLVASQTNGQIVTKLTALPRATVTATELQLFVSPDGGTTKRFIGSKLMSAYTFSTTTAATATDYGYTVSAPLELAAGESLYVAQSVTLAGGIVHRYEGAAF